MKFTLSWLKTHLETDADLETICDRLTMIGLELEGIDNRAEKLAPFVIAEVKAAEKHPDADKLQVCTVFNGSEELQIVCGAPNARAGMKAVLAPVGTWVPGLDVKLKKGKIRGVDSLGMMCSESELELSDSHDGIIDLPADAPVGQSYAAWAGLDDVIIEIAITPNRGDALGVRGIARDLAAAGLGTLKPLTVPALQGGFDSPLTLRHDLPEDKKDACPLFLGRYIKGVKNGPSPAWLQDRLRALGMRPISALVDMTNFISFDLGRPLHVFDADKLDRGIVVRMAKEGETVTALDEKEYSLDPEMTVIADESAPQGIGGIMGGLDSGCTDDTVNVFLEAALFDPIRIAATGRKLNISSDARYRFERGVDPSFVPDAIEIATQMILDLCGGEVSHVLTSGEAPAWQRKVTLRGERVKALTGMELSLADQKSILERLGYGVTEEAGNLVCDVPAFRTDVHLEADLVEEVSRIHGYDHLVTEPLPRLNIIGKPTRTPMQRRTSAVRRGLAVRGLHEVVTFSFMSSEYTGLFGGNIDGLKLINPISADLDEMRPSILPNLLLAGQRNADRGQTELSLFELGPQFSGARPEDQILAATGVRMGQSGNRHWAGKPGPVDVFMAKADALAALAACDAPVDKLQITTDAPSWYHPGRSGVLRLGPKVMGQFGELHPAVLKALDVKGPAVAFEVFPANVPFPKAKGAKTRPALELSAFQPVSRDFAFLLEESVPAESILKAARGADKTLITDVAVFDVYMGKGMEPGQKSVAIAVTLSPTKKTLTDEEIEAVCQKIIASVSKATGATLRG